MRPDHSDWIEAQIGRVLGDRWTVIRLLGTGGTAAVFEARHRNGKRVAIKMLRPERAGERRLRNRFLREGYVANRVGHPSVVSIDDDGFEEDGTAFLVMELLESDPLDEVARRFGGRLPWLTVAELALELLDVLEAAHERGIVHRDIKPANLFWAPGHPLRVVDFGLARSSEPLPSDEVTRDDAVLGTPAFMAPEQARAANATVGVPSDLWSVGATAFVLITGRPVYAAPTPEEQLALAATTAAPDLSSLAPEVPEEVVRVFQRALSYDIADRYASAREMHEALRDALARKTTLQPVAEPASDDATFHNTVDTTAVPPNGARRPGSFKISWLVMALTLVLAALVTSSLVTFRRPAPARLVGAPYSADPISTVQAAARLERSVGSKSKTTPEPSTTPPTVPSHRPGARTVAAPSGFRLIEEPPF